MRLIHYILLCTLAGPPLEICGQEVMYSGQEGQVHFSSNAPLELIDAESGQLSGIINPQTHGVAFSVRIQSFKGFNSAVQREHFMENYLEVTKYPVATFTGRILEKIRFLDPGIHEVRVKGILNIHGVSVERIIPGEISIASNEVTIHAEFTVPLAEHAITVPKLLSQKIAETITVRIDIVLHKTA